jgi:hypothetical protein
MNVSRIGLLAVCFALSLLAGGTRLLAQQATRQTDHQQTGGSIVSPVDTPEARPSVRKGAPEQVPTHRFWDRENAWLFAGVGAARALDYTSTLNMRRRGRQEILLTNWVVDDHPLFAGIEAGGTALSIGASYLFHRTGHHEMERWVSIVHISVATVGDIRNYSLQTAHPAAPKVGP